MSQFEAILLENVRIPQSEIELKQIEAGWAAGDRITAAPHRGVVAVAGM